MMAAAAALEGGKKSPSKEALTVSPATTQPRRGASTGTLSSTSLLHDSSALGTNSNNPPSTPTPEAALPNSTTPLSTPTGTKLAVSTPSDSPAGEEGVHTILDEEKKIALSQLQELEVAIKVRKVTKVDGRKVRWIEYRARKQAEGKNQGLSKRTRRSKNRSKEENSENDVSVINNNNNTKSDSTMKVECVSPPVNGVGTSNVLESMKQQFLQGTDAISNGKVGVLTEAVASTQRRKSGRTRKTVNGQEIGSSNNTSPEKISPKSENMPPGSASDSDASCSLPSTPVSGLDPNQPHAGTLILKKSFSLPRSLTKGLREVRKSENGADVPSPAKAESVNTPVSSMLLSSVVSEDSADIKSLVDKDAISPKEETETSTTMEINGTETPDTKSSVSKVSTESKTTAAKPAFSLVKAAAKLLSPASSRSKSADSSGKMKKTTPQKGGTKKNLTKSSGRSLSEPRKAVNGFSESLHNGSADLNDTGTLDKISNTLESPLLHNESDTVVKRPRGRPPKKKYNRKKDNSPSLGKSGKKTSTVVVDVHNTMNGEPQTVIPLTRPLLRGKRISPGKKMSQPSVANLLTVLSDSKDSKDGSPSAKRQKAKEAKDKSSMEEVDSTDNIVPAVQKGKSVVGKKKKIEPVNDDVKPSENTSASKLNQIEVSSEKIQSTKSAKIIQKPTQQKVPSLSKVSTASLSLPTKTKMKPGPKPQGLKTKNKASGKTKTSARLKVPLQKAVSAYKKKTITKAKKKETRILKPGLKNPQVEEDSDHNTCKNAEEEESLQNNTKMDTSVNNSSLLDSTGISLKSEVKEAEQPKEEDIPIKAIPVTPLRDNLLTKFKSSPKTPVSDNLSVRDNQSLKSSSKTPISDNVSLNLIPKPSLKTPISDNVSLNLTPENPADELCLKLSPDKQLKESSYINSSPEKPTKDDTFEEVPPEKPVSQEKDTVERSSLEITSSEDNKAENTPSQAVSGDIVPKEKEGDVSLPNNNSLSTSGENEDILSNNNSLIGSKTMESLQNESRLSKSCSQNNNDPLLKDKVISKDEAEKSSIDKQPDIPSTDKLPATEVIKESEKITLGKEFYAKDTDSLKTAQVVEGTSKTLKESLEEVNKQVEREPVTVSKVIPGKSDCGIEKESSVTNKNSKHDESPSKKDQSDITDKLTIYDFPSPERVSPHKDSSFRSISNSQTIRSPQEKASIPSLSIQKPLAKQRSRETIDDASRSMSTKVSEATNISLCRPNSNLTVWRTADVEITVIKNSQQSPNKVQRSPTKEYTSSVSITASESQQKQSEKREFSQAKREVSPPKREISHIKKMLKRDNEPINKQEKYKTKDKMTKAQNTSQETPTDPSVEASENKDPSKPVDSNEPALTTAAASSEVSTTTKAKEKVPRILKQLFQDEGVQNMLKSMSEESGAVPETSPNSESGVHKLRPKRPTEPMLSSSPELDALEEELLLSVTKKKRRVNEVDNLYSDEGVLNLLTSLEPHSRRSHLDDAASDTSQASSSRSIKTSKTLKVPEAGSESRKRKMSGASSVSSCSSKYMHPPDAKRIRPDGQEASQDPYELYATGTEEFRENIVRVDNTALELEVNLAKKKGRPTLPLSVKQKNKAIRMQLKLQKQKQIKGVSGENLELREDDNINLAELQAALRTEKDSFEMPLQLSSLENNKSVPPLKIKLPSDSVTIKHITRPTPIPQMPGVTVLPRPPAKPAPKPHMMDMPNRLPQPRAPPPRPHPMSTLPTMQARPSFTPPDSSRVIIRHSGEKPRTFPERRTPPPAPLPHRRLDHLTTTLLPGQGFTSLVRGFDLGGSSGLGGNVAGVSRNRPQRMGGETLRQSQRASVRQSEGNYHYRDITLKKFNNFTQIILSPSTTKMKNALNSRVLRELCEALNLLRRDETVKMVLLTGTGSTFCQGVDLTALQHPNIETRKKNAENLVRGIKEFLKVLVQFPKPLIAGVNGNAMGLGVTMLPLFDSVIANDKAEFYLPYAALGQVPEGGATYTFPNLFGKLQSTKLFQGYKVTATMAMELGLASETLWPATFQEKLIPKVALLATQSSQSMEATKALMNHHLVTKLELSLESECRVLLQQWTSPHFTHLCKKFLDTHHIHLQKPVNLPL